MVFALEYFRWKTIREWIIALVAIGGLGLGLFNTFIKTDINPKVEYFFEENEGMDKWDFFTLKNNGPFDIVSVTVSIQRYGYEKGGRKWYLFSGDKPGFSDYSFVARSIKAFEQARIKTHSETTIGNVNINAIVFDVVYYRESDMNPYEAHIVYLVDDGVVYNRKEALEDDYMRSDCMA